MSEEHVEAPQNPKPSRRTFPIGPLAWIVFTPLLTIPLTWMATGVLTPFDTRSYATFESIQAAAAADHYCNVSISDVNSIFGTVSANAACPDGYVLAALSPGLLNLAPLLWLIFGGRTSRRTALLASVLGGARFLVPVIGVLAVVPSVEYPHIPSGYALITPAEPYAYPNSWSVVPLFSLLLWIATVLAYFVDRSVAHRRAVPVDAAPARERGKLGRLSSGLLHGSVLALLALPMMAFSASCDSAYDFEAHVTGYQSLLGFSLGQATPSAVGTDSLTPVQVIDLPAVGPNVWMVLLVVAVLGGLAAGALGGMRAAAFRAATAAVGIAAVWSALNTPGSFQYRGLTVDENPDWGVILITVALGIALVIDGINLVRLARAPSPVKTKPG